MSDWGTVLCRCRKCGKLIERPSTKTGVLFSCGKCQHVQKTSAVATQEQATAEQLKVIERAIRWHHYAIIAATPLMAILITLVIVAIVWAPSYGRFVNSQFIWAVLALRILTGCAIIFLLCAETRSIEFLGGGNGNSLMLFIFCGPVWLIRTVVAYFRIRSAARRLRLAGPGDLDVPPPPVPA
jgi:phage FluMu protein Com